MKSLCERCVFLLKNKIEKLLFKAKQLVFFVFIYFWSCINLFIRFSYTPTRTQTQTNLSNLTDQQMTTTRNKMEWEKRRQILSPKDIDWNRKTQFRDKIRCICVNTLTIFEQKFMAFFMVGFRFWNIHRFTKMKPLKKLKYFLR